MWKYRKPCILLLARGYQEPTRSVSQIRILRLPIGRRVLASLIRCRPRSSTINASLFRQDTTDRQMAPGGCQRAPGGSHRQGTKLIVLEAILDLPWQYSLLQELCLQGSLPAGIEPPLNPANLTLV